MTVKFIKSRSFNFAVEAIYNGMNAHIFKDFSQNIHFYPLPIATFIIMKAAASVRMNVMQISTLAQFSMQFVFVYVHLINGEMKTRWEEEDDLYLYCDHRIECG